MISFLKVRFTKKIFGAGINMKIEKYYIHAYPEIMYYLPSGSPGYKIMVTEDPYEGVNAKLIKE